MKDPSSLEAALQTSGKDYFVPALEGQNRGEQNYSKRLKTSLSGPGSEWHCSQEQLLMVTAGRQDTEPRGSSVLTQNDLMHVIRHSKIQKGQTDSVHSTTASNLS